VQAYRNAFSTAMDDDLDTPTAIRVLEEVAEGLEEGRLAAETGVPTLLELADVLGLRLGREG
jgi:cysteinyl-tRNA synthetase